MGTMKFPNPMAASRCSRSRFWIAGSTKMKISQKLEEIRNRLMGMRMTLTRTRSRWENHLDHWIISGIRAAEGRWDKGGEMDLTLFYFFIECEYFLLKFSRIKNILQFPRGCNQCYPTILLVHGDWPAGRDYVNFLWRCEIKSFHDS